MREDFLMDAVSHLDTEVIENYHKYKDRLKARKKNKKAVVRWTAMAACLIIFFAVSYPIIEKFIPRKMGGEIGEYEICSSEVKFIGEPIKENELKNYLMEQESYILSYISKKINVDVNSLRICDKGIYHVNATQKSNYVNYDTITYFVMDKDCSVIASVDLFRDGNTLNFQVHTLGLAITELNRILSERPNTDFAMIYIGASIEALIAPDNTIYFLNCKKEVQENIDYYSMFNKEINLINFDLLNIESGSARNRKELKEIISDNFGYMMDSVLKRAELSNLSEQKIEEFSVLKPVSFNKIDATNNNSESVFHFPIPSFSKYCCNIYIKNLILERRITL